MTDTFYDDIREYLLTRIETLPDVGPIHKYYRYSSTVKDLFNLFVLARQFRGWMFSRESLTPRTTGGNVLYLDHEFVLRPYYGVQDAVGSELVFQNHLDRVVHLFETDFRMGGLAVRTSPVSVRRITHRQFAGVVCHSADLALTVTEARLRA